LSTLEMSLCSVAWNSKAFQGMANSLFTMLRKSPMERAPRKPDGHL
jgi:hypothetical protein